MTLRNSITAAIVLASLHASPVMAQNVTADVEQIAEIMRGEGLQAKIEYDDGRPSIASGISGYNFAVHPYGCNDEWKDCKFIQFRSSFATEDKLTLEQINTFAADNFFGRFYLDDEREPVIEMDLDLEAGGMSKELFVDNIAYWDMILAKFGDYVFSDDR